VPPPGPAGRVRGGDARFQQWRALLDNRVKRQRLASFLVQGVIPITSAIDHGWEIRTLLHAGAATSAWARDLLTGSVPAERIELAPALLAELGQRDDGPPELVAVVAVPPDDLGRLGPSPTARGPVVVSDRPANPGNLGSLLRSADALGASGVIVVGHATDLYDPRTVRAGRGSLFARPAVRVASPADVLAWLAHLDPPPQLVGATEDGAEVLWDHDFTGPTAIVVGNEATGLSRAWLDACHHTVRIPMVGSATSLNAAASASVLLYEVFRQRFSAGEEGTRTTGGVAPGS
jgi:tRNA G18 (ribose-2'-O)-methylase SpoU